MILVVGGTGKVGSVVVRELAAAGHDVRSLSRDPGKAPADSTGRVETVRGDLSDPPSLAAALRGAEKVFLVSSADPQVKSLHLNLFREARKTGVRHLVRLSAMGAGKKGPVSLLKAHTETDEALAASDIPYTILRPHYFLQNFYMSLPSIKEQGAFYAPMGNGKIPAIDVRDVGAFGAHVLTTAGHQGKTYEITGPEALSFAAMATALSAAAGREIKYVDIPPAEALKAIRGMGVPEWLADGLVKLYQYFAAGNASDVTTTFREVTGRAPRTFDDFAREFAQALRQG